MKTLRSPGVSHRTPRPKAGRNRALVKRDLSVLEVTVVLQDTATLASQLGDPNLSQLLLDWALEAETHITHQEQRPIKERRGT